VAVLDPVITDVESKLREVIEALDHRLTAAENLSPEGTIGQVLTSRGPGLTPMFVDIGSSVGGIPAGAHTHDASEVVSGQFADSRISLSGVKQYEGSLTINATQVTAGTFGAGNFIFQNLITATSIRLGITDAFVTLSRGGTNFFNYTADAGDGLVFMAGSGGLVDIGIDGSAKVRIATSGNILIPATISEAGARLHIEKDIGGDTGTTERAIFGVQRATAAATQVRISVEAHAGVSATTGTVANSWAMEAFNVVTGAAALTNAEGIRVQSHWQTGAGAATTYHGIHILDPIMTAGSIATVYGLKIESIAAGATDYAIYTDAGKVRLGDSVEIHKDNPDIGFVDTGTPRTWNLGVNGSSGFFFVTDLTAAQSRLRFDAASGGTFLHHDGIALKPGTAGGLTLGTMILPWAELHIGLTDAFLQIVRQGPNNIVVQAAAGDSVNWRTENQSDFTVGTTAYCRLTNDGAWGLRDGITAPATDGTFALLFVDAADGDLKIKFGDGTVKLIVTDT
jgi:hypothetical protein